MNMNIIVEAPTMAATTGALKVGDLSFPCTLGGAGIIHAADKIEGDKKTPIGTYPLRRVLYRADRLAKPETGLPVDVLTPDTGWCEDPRHPDYNCQVKIPHPAVTDHMSREDNLYDCVVIVGHNDDPVVPDKGSAIFMHLARLDFTPTAGCVGLLLSDLMAVLKLCETDTMITIGLRPDSRS